MVSESLEQDDLYVDMTFAKVLDDKGIDATTEDFGEHVPRRQVQALARQPGGAAGAQARRRAGTHGHAAATTRTPTTSISRSNPISSG